MLKLKTQLDIVKYSLWVKHFSARGRPGGVGPPSVNLGPPNISENTKKVEIENPIRHSNVLASGTKKFPLGGVQGGTAPPNLNMGPPKISETT